MQSLACKQKENVMLYRDTISYCIIKNITSKKTGVSVQKTKVA